MRTLVHNGNKIEIDMVNFTGLETIYYNGAVVSSKHSITGGDHLFTVKENGEDATYEIKIGVAGITKRVNLIITLNGELLFSDHDLGHTHE